MTNADRATAAIHEWNSSREPCGLDSIGRPVAGCVISHGICHVDLDKYRLVVPEDWMDVPAVVMGLRVVFDRDALVAEVLPLPGG